jgi:DNA invertase Pin-like site-specific DNA recombinase
VQVVEVLAPEKEALVLKEMVRQIKRERYSSSEKGKKSRKRYMKRVRKQNDVNRKRIRLLQASKPKVWEEVVKRFTTPISQEDVERFSNV